MVIDIQEQIKELAWTVLRESVDKNAKLCDVIEAYCVSASLRDKVMSKIEDLISTINYRKNKF